MSSVQLSRVRLFVTPGTAACQASLSITNSQSLLKMSWLGLKYLLFLVGVMNSIYLIYIYCGK